MSTRSDIIVCRSDGKVARSYCHWDGYLQGVGKDLVEHYTTQDKVEALSALGDLSSLGPRCTKPRGHSYEKPKKGYTVAYGRDRGQKGTEADIFDTLSEAWPEPGTWTEFTYVWKDGQWWVASADEGAQALVPLDDAIAGKVDLNARVKVPFVGVIGTHGRGS